MGLVDDLMPKVGRPAPNFVLPSLDGGKPISSEQFRGQTLVLNFWASWCPPCRAEMPDFQELWEERGPDGDLVVLAVNFLAEDTVDAAAGVVEEFGLTFPVATDTPNGDVGRRYGVRGLPATFFIDRDGILRQRSLGPVFGNLLPEGVAAADNPA
jgi:peroxiredoxin